jgi:hypothetical protein
MRQRTEAIEITTSSGAARYEELVNRPDIRVTKSSDFFACMPGGEGEPPEAIVTRVLDFTETELDVAARAYTPPMC